MSTLISVAAMTSVAVAVNGGPGSRGNGSRRAVRWAVENLSADADTLILIHVMPAITSIPTPCTSLFSSTLLGSREIVGKPKPFVGPQADLLEDFKFSCVFLCFLGKWREKKYWILWSSYAKSSSPYGIVWLRK